MEFENKHCADHQYFITLVETTKSTAEDVKMVKEFLIGTLEKEGISSRMKTVETDVGELKQLRKDLTRSTFVSIGQIILVFIGVIATFVFGKIQF